MVGAKEQQDRGLKRKNDSSDKSTPPEFQRSLAVVIGIDRYSNGIPPLSTAVNDAQGLADILKGEEHGYEVILLTDEEATLSHLEKLFCEDLPEKIGKDDRLVVYFAGHGVATDGDDGPAGFLIPQDAKREASSTFFPMTELHEALEALPCRHMLAILDCCFAGAFRWSSKRDFQPLPPVIYKERYDRFIRDAAWQVITSASYDQKALDILSGTMRGEQDARQGQQHSPFALALFDALGGAADTTPKDGDGVITATELYLYLRDKVEIPAEELAAHRQTPGLWPLNRHEHGEFIFLVPGHELNLPPAPDLTEKNNPYKGLSPYEKGDSELFFGRTDLVKKLKRRVAKLPFTVVLGASGTGKSSLVKAGLLPALEHNATYEKQPEEVKGTSQPSSWFILERVTEKDGKKKKEVMRPGANPLATLCSLLINDLPGVRPERKGGATPAGMIGQWRKKNPGLKLLLVIDQFEELITLCREEQARKDFIRELRQALDEHSKVLRIVLTLRSDFEAQISHNYLKDCWRQNYRFVVPPMTQDELREVIEEPASLRVLYFEPRKLVDDLINEVVQTPGSLPLLSFTLSELYRRYVKRQKDMKQQDSNRALTKADYEKMGGIIGSLRSRIEQKYNELDVAQKKTLRRILLRMVAFEGGELTRRQAPEWEFTYPNVKETKEVEELLKGLTKNRLIVVDERNDAKGDAEPYYEAVHDSLIVAWDKMFEWRDNEAEKMLLHRQLTRAAADWRRGENEKEQKALLWDNSPRLLRVQEFLEQENLGDTEGGTKVERKQGSFRLLRQFCKNLCPSFESLEQHVWLNRVETDFVRRSIERKRNWTRGVSASIMIIFLALATAWWITDDARIEAQAARDVADEEREKAVEQEGIAKEQTREAKRQLSKNYRVSSITARKENRPIVSLHYNARAASVIDNDYESKIFLFDQLNRENYYLVKMMPNKGNINRGVYNREKDRLVTWGEDEATLWDANTGEKIKVINSSTGITTIQNFISSGNNEKFLYSSGNVIYIWDSSSLEITSHIAYSKIIIDFALFINYDGTEIAALDKKGIITIIKLHKDNTWELGNSYPGNFTDLTELSKNDKDNKKLRSKIARDKTLKIMNDKAIILNDKTGESVGYPLHHNSDVMGAFFNRNETGLITYSNDETAKLWSANPGIMIQQKVLRTMQHEDLVIGGILNPDENKILTWSKDKTVKLWDININTNTGRNLLRDYLLQGAVFSKKGEKILVWSADNSAKIINAKTGKIIGQPMHHNVLIQAAFFTDNENRILTWTNDTRRLWNPNSGLTIGPPARVGTGMEIIYFSTRGDEIIDDNPIQGFHLSSDGTRILTWHKDNSVRIWDTDGNWKGPGIPGDIDSIGEDLIKDAVINDTKQQFAVLYKDNTVQLFNADSGTVIGVPLRDESPVTGVLISNHETKVLTWNDDNTAKLWNPDNGAIIGKPMIHSGQISGARFNNNETRVLTWSKDGAARLFDANSGIMIGTPMQHNDAVNGAIFNKNETEILTWSDDGTARLWSIEMDYDFPNEHLPLFVEVATGTVMDDSGNIRALTKEEWEERKTKYIQIAEEHLDKPCQHKEVNFYLQHQKPAWNRTTKP